MNLHMPASWMPAAWTLLLEAGKDFGLEIFGLEAQNVLRLEKGHVIIGQDSEIRTTLHDLGLGRLWYRHKTEAKTIGAFTLKQTEHRKDRLKLTGFEMEPGARTPKDCSIIVVADKILGHVCTARYSAALEKSIGLALVDSSLSENGSQLKIFEDNCDGNLLSATVVPTPFYDPKGERMKS